MKKLMIAAAIVCAAAFVQAATVDWSAMTFGMPDAVDGDYTGSATLSCAALDFSTTVDISGGMLMWMGQIESELEASYDFLLTATETVGGDTYTYSVAGGGTTDAMYSGTVTFDPGSWSKQPGPGPVVTPEPTSGLLLLLGVAGLALRRKQK